MDDGRTLVEHSTIVIGLPCYNEERFLQRAIDSIKQQTWTDFVVLISDNASTDGTGAIGERAALADPRFRYHRHDRNIGASENFNFVLEASESPFLVWLGGHDMIAPRFLEMHLAAMLADPRISLSYSRTGWIDENDEIVRLSMPTLDELSPRRLQRYVQAVMRIGECTPINNMIRRDSLAELRFGPVVACDHVLLARLAYNGIFNVESEPLYLRRELAHERQAYMERLTGQKDLKEDFRPLVDMYLQDFVRLRGADPLLPFTRRLLRVHVEKRFRLRRKGPLLHLVDRPLILGWRMVDRALTAFDRWRAAVGARVRGPRTGLQGSD